jgi:hypothetical protein
MLWVRVIILLSEGRIPTGETTNDRNVVWWSVYKQYCLLGYMPLVQQFTDVSEEHAIFLTPASLWLVASLTLRPWRWRGYVPPRRRWASTRLYGYISDKTVVSLYKRVTWRCYSSIWGWRSGILWGVSVDKAILRSGLELGTCRK